MTAQIDQDLVETPWIEWAGGECPVAPETVIEPCYRAAPDPVKGIRRGIAPAGQFAWHHDGEDDDIIAYRIDEPFLCAGCGAPSPDGVKPCDCATWSGFKRSDLKQGCRFIVPKDMAPELFLTSPACELYAALAGVLDGIPMPETVNEYELVQAGCDPTEAQTLANAWHALELARRHP